MTRRIPEDVRALIDVPESEWSMRASGLVWSLERRHVRKFFTGAMRCKSVRAFNYELSRGGFQSAVFVFAFNFWSQLSLLFAPIFLVLLTLGAGSGHSPGTQRSEFAIGWVAGVAMAILLGIGALRLMHGRRVYGRQFERRASVLASEQGRR